MAPSWWKEWSAPATKWLCSTEAEKRFSPRPCAAPLYSPRTGCGFARRVENPEANFIVIMKDGRIYKNLTEK
jgi:hypothetical protein